MSDPSKKPKSPILGLFKEVFNWYPSSYPAEERKLLLGSISPTWSAPASAVSPFFVCSEHHLTKSVFVKYLDQTNISNAARWLLPTLEILWGSCTFAQSRVRNVHQLYALRFLVGMFEAPVFAETHFILGSWYSGSDLFNRAGTWFICNPLSQIISGYLQAAAYTNLSGVGGMPGWRWLFIIDGIFTIPVALIGFLVFPGVPDSPAPFFLTKRDIEIAKDWLSRAKIRRPGSLGPDVFKRTAKRWHIYIFLFSYACMILSSYPSSYMNLWLKDEGYSVTKINQYPTIIQTITIVSSWLGTTLASIYPSWIIYTIISTFSLFSTLCMCICCIPTGLKRDQKRKQLAGESES
ncbi:hypothetical protein AN6381.2 [Aspergillus nidulans FGSC A4]|uniref:Major facilitator superfamily (MFS) profile domain-containing protein n=1 Tax=Emericella nidulans (strain FGSC A4 / ATCC 38163 / CBS 112.46 / NRRL 194 / M139) TaxID=227321 RepID=Q5AZ99_EMENI|nr:hypothetical protein [Aspergillus nidulans FGSC A4]EAA58765.1 hypothetical protein AN6381.2 [Aspergillus nidulans FGSC A4]CBF69587.1 TPA: conserved hypothetical protein [Aspergillus nidulans FGSC A4]|eukprot:XP_663985.1 hypothetical protein AN6381.2 [Aspergillus nidulans FGSC A4]